MTDDDDLFAPRPVSKPAAQPEPKNAPICQPALPPRRTRRVPDVSRGPVATLACRCGAREEVKEPCPDRLDCWRCNGLETMIRYQPRYTPPAQAGRALTAHEVEGMKLDAANLS